MPPDLEAAPLATAVAPDGRIIADRLESGGVVLTTTGAPVDAGAIVSTTRDGAAVLVRSPNGDVVLLLDEHGEAIGDIHPTVDDDVMIMGGLVVRPDPRNGAVVHLPARR